MKFWYNPLLLESLSVGMQPFGMFVKSNYTKFEIDDDIALHMKRAFANGLDKKYLPEELDNFFNWTENKAWEQLAINRDFVKIDENTITANNPTLVWATLKALYFDNKLNIDEIVIEIIKDNDDIKIVSIDQDLLKTILQNGATTLIDYIKNS